MLLLNLIPLIDVTFSTPTRYYANQSMREHKCAEEQVFENAMNRIRRCFRGIDQTMQIAEGVCLLPRSMATKSVAGINLGRDLEHNSEPLRTSPTRCAVKIPCRVVRAIHCSTTLMPDRAVTISGILRLLMRRKTIPFPLEQLEPIYFGWVSLIASTSLRSYAKRQNLNRVTLGYQLTLTHDAPFEYSNHTVPFREASGKIAQLTNRGGRDLSGQHRRTK